MAEASTISAASTELSFIRIYFERQQLTAQLIYCD